ncbi:diaminopimelate decarboxylase [Pseudoxanthomonas sacheonensis]|uniref:Diaminopimelate decarboxylase n=1 Tax=Pseudoxanthomonas sacheonensis TaxID=443615 RepID=A0ABU1RP42_9GAMM|nr:diaminopimelate decarboxylase [Pseudoxanthomonas sacheonensis]MDR6840533.1 diaminopimelate decarboxylase [Pseudoxanthomonas sacheonensis]
MELIGAQVAAPSQEALESPFPRLFDGMDLIALGAALPTPFHAYSANTIRQRISGLQAALDGLNAAICFAVKANPSLAILQIMAQSGLGADIVSSGELRRSLKAGIPANRIVFSGVGKTEAEMGEAIDVGVGRFNVESSEELEALQRAARTREAIVRASVRINPDVDAGTHDKISTGKSDNKFGVSITEARRWFAAVSCKENVRLDGLHVHIGSQILELEPFRQALHHVSVFWRELVLAGHSINSIDVGGGLGVVYRGARDKPVNVGDYVHTIREALTGFEGRIVLEPGRYLVAEAGILLTRVIRTKQGATRNFLIVDAAMNDLLRPSLYDAWHDIELIDEESDRNDLRPGTVYDIVGPVCETSDTFAIGRQLPQCRAGDLLAIRCTGAYGASMSSTYNSRPLAAEVLVDDGSYAVIRRRQSFDEMIAGEQAATLWRTA